MTAGEAAFAAITNEWETPKHKKAAREGGFLVDQAVRISLEADASAGGDNID
jgi:hypothetical protein